MTVQELMVALLLPIFTTISQSNIFSVLHLDFHYKIVSENDIIIVNTLVMTSCVQALVDLLLLIMFHQEEREMDITL